MSLSIGIVGLPNVGKSTLFNALTRAGAVASNYPFATIDPNIGVVGVPDPRLAELAKLYDSARIVPASVRFTDIAGLVRGASQGQGLGDQFLAHIRETDAICQVVRVFADPDVTHVDGDVSPERDIETVVTELILADLQTLEKALPRLAKETKFAKDPERARTAEAAAAAQQLLDTGTALSAGAAAAGIDAGLAALRELQLLTAKPFLYVFNMDTSELGDDDLRKRLSALVAPAEAIFLDAKTEADLAELPADEAAELLAEAGLGEPGLAQLARAGFRALGLQTFLTGGPEGDPGLGDQGRGDGPGGGRRHPHRLPARLYQGRGGLVRRPDRGRLAARGPGGGQGSHRGQGLRHARWRRGGVPAQLTMTTRENLDIIQLTNPGEADPVVRQDLTACWIAVTNAGGAAGFPFPPVDASQVRPACPCSCFLRDPSQTRILLARVGSALAGWVALSRDPSPLISHWGVVSHLQTQLAHRSEGIGLALMQRLREVARDEMGLEQLHLAARGGMGLEDFYSRLGWRTIGRWPGKLRLAPDDTRDEILMILTPL